MEIGQLHLVGIDDTESPDPGRGQIHRGGRTKTTCPDEQDTGRAQFVLPGRPEFRQGQLARIARRFVRGP